MRWALIILCLLYCTPVFADRIYELESKVTTQQEQLATLQEQVELLQGRVQALVGGRREWSVEEDQEIANAKIRTKEPRVRVKVKPGYVELRREKSSIGSVRVGGGARQARVGGGGPGLSAELDIRATRRMSFNLTFDGTLDRIGGKDFFSTPGSSGPISGIPLSGATSSELTNRTRLFVGGPNLRYRVFSLGEQASLDFSAGFEALSLQFRSMDKDIITSGRRSGIVTTTRRKEKYFGYGPRFGLAASFKPTERLGFSAEGFYTTFLDLSGSKERTTSGGTDFPTEGHAFRFDLGTSYEIRKGIRLGVGYRGYLLNIDQSKTKSVGSGSGRVGSTNVSMEAQDWRTDLFYGSIGVDF